MFGPAILVSPVLQPDADAEKNNTIPPNQRINNDENSRWDLMISSRRTDPNTRRTVYLRDSPAWYDFWTGASQKGGREIDADAPLDRIPLYVRAGSIIPLGPEMEYTSEKPAGPIELRVYKGADGTFDLYQDAGDSYDYEKGAHAVMRNMRILPLSSFRQDWTGRISSN